MHMLSLPSPRPPYSSGMREAEHAELRDLGDDVKRDVLVLQVPLVRVRHDLGLRELAHLLVDRGVCVIEAGIAEGGGAGLSGNELGKPRLHTLTRAGSNERCDLVLEATNLQTRDAQYIGTDDLDLAHGDAARDLRQVLGKCGDEDELLELAEAAL